MCGMDRYEWSPRPYITVAVERAGLRPLSLWIEPDSQRGGVFNAERLMAAEILRLAERVRELEATVQETRGEEASLRASYSSFADKSSAAYKALEEENRRLRGVLRAIRDVCSTTRHAPDVEAGLTEPLLDDLERLLAAHPVTPG